MHSFDPANAREYLSKLPAVVKIDGTQIESKIRPI
jgi:hypothetical protein